jgi:hypothetical protein
MRGKLATLLASALPRKIPLLRATWGLDDNSLPMITDITSGESVENALTSKKDSWILVINPRLLKTDQVDIDPTGLPVYNARYSCRIMVWAIGVNWDAAIEARDNLAVAVRLCLLEWPNLEYGTYGNTNFRLHRNTYTEEFGVPMRTQGNSAGGRVWAGAQLSVDVDREDGLTDGSLRPPIGAANTVTTTAHAVGPTEPMP